MLVKDGPNHDEQKQQQKQFNHYGMSGTPSVVFNTTSSSSQPFQHQSQHIASGSTFGSSFLSPFYQGNAHATDSAALNNGDGNPSVLPPRQQAISGQSPTFGASPFLQGQDPQQLQVPSQHQKYHSSNNEGHNFRDSGQSDQGNNNFTVLNESQNIATSFGTSANLVAPSSSVGSSSREYLKKTGFGFGSGSNNFGKAYASPNLFSSESRTTAPSTLHPGSENTSKLVFSQGSNVQRFDEMGRGGWSSRNDNSIPLNMGGTSAAVPNPTRSLGTVSSEVTQHSVGAMAPRNIEMDNEEEEIRHGSEDNHQYGAEESVSINGQQPLYRNKEWVNPNSWKKTNPLSSTSAALEAHEKKAKELAILRAKLEEKKKKMMEIKLKSQTMNTAGGSVSFANNDETIKNTALHNRNSIMTKNKAQTRSDENEIASSFHPDDKNLTPRTKGDQSTHKLLTPKSKRIISSNASKRPHTKPMSDSEVKSGTGNIENYTASPSPRKSLDIETVTRSKKQNATRLITTPVPHDDSVAVVLDKDRNAELMTKNLQRFSQTQNRATISMLPKELQDRVKSDVGHSCVKMEEGKQHASELTSNADLVGTCVYMCPDEELLRRESENDIQLLELPHSAIHPKEWTLRETAIKRFRRSAADFKLDIPDLVRPPHILERVCGYLEEWVMERDRQGGDPRFGGQVPPPLEVYQFIWDRTRMVRKDFILQNYVGTGGRCNAIAVRCHERIARWHAMCEHQLSHLPDFISMQSQQNIQELGATMKSLNMYYDDAAGRSTKDAPSLSRSFVHGCESSTVMGNNPIDYDGQTLKNRCEAVELSSRIIGIVGCSGTAEPEMRGLYILLTMNNDGGMEVLKYAARLLRDRPEIFQSSHVQLALQVYKAKRENNYAKFFSLLRSKSTPYLYACIMFKYVESMRKAAFRIMSKTYGAKKKDSGEGIYDEYPLKDLVHLLCFEDEEEARNACEHYNITVKKLPLKKSSDGHVEIIFWRKSYFLEPRDPAKGVLIHLKPKKMNRVIEKKLSGATRLAICRGEVSGIGATVEKPRASKTSQLSETVKTEKECLEVNSNAVEIVAVKKKIEERQVLPPIVSLVSPQSKVQYDTHRKGISEFQLSYSKEIENNFVKHWDAKDIKLRRKEEVIVLQTDEEHKLKTVQSKKQLKLDRRRKEEAQQQEKVREEAEEKHRIQEIHRQELIAIQKQQEEVERQERARQAEQRRIELEWQTKIAYAKKLLAWNKLITRFRVKHLVRMETHSQIESFNPLHRIDSDLFFVEQYLTGSKVKESTQIKELKPQGYSIETIFYRLATDNTSPLALHDLLFNELLSNGCFLEMNRVKFGNGASKNCVMFKLGISLVGKYLDNDLMNMVKMWIDQRLKLGRVYSKCEGMNEVRTCAQIYDKTEATSNEFNAILEINLFENGANEKNQKSCREDTLYHVMTIGGFKRPMDLDNMLLEGCKRLLTEFTMSWHLCEKDQQPKTIERISIRQLYYLLVRQGLGCVNFDRNGNSEVLSHDLQYDIKGDIAEKVVNHFLDVARYVVEMVSITQGLGSSWPFNDFLIDGVVPRYFNGEEGLPKEWNKSTDKSRLQDLVRIILPSLKHEKPILIDILHDLIDDAPVDIKQYCSYLFNKYEYIECLETGLKWRESVDQYSVCDVYLPLGRAASITKSYFEETKIPKPTILQRRDIYLNYDVATNSENYLSGHEDNDDSDENTTPKNNIITMQPKSRHKRPWSADSIDDKDQKKSKVESKELLTSKTFTENLKAMCTDHEGLANIVNDPLFSKLIASNDFLREFVGQNSKVLRP